MARFLRGAKSIYVEGLWTKDRTPVGEVEWERTFEALVGRLFSEVDAFDAWIYDLEVRTTRQRAQRETRVEELVTSRSLLARERLVRTRERLARELERALLMYNVLRSGSVWDTEG
jgi:hypothetical protein